MTPLHTCTISTPLINQHIKSADITSKHILRSDRVFVFPNVYLMSDLLNYNSNTLVLTNNNAWLRYADWLLD